LQGSFTKELFIKIRRETALLSLSVNVNWLLLRSLLDFLLCTDHLH